MTTIYRCDNCGKEFSDFRDVVILEYNCHVPNPADLLHQVIGEYCKDCIKKIEARIKEGVQ